MDIATTNEGLSTTRSLAFLPLVIALAGGFIQLISCGTPFVDVGVPVGLVVSLGSVVVGHIITYRIKKRKLNGRGLARFGLMAGYLAVFLIPIVGCGILLIVGGICG